MSNQVSQEVLNLLSSPESRLVWEEEGVLGSYALGIEKALKEKGMNKSDLARLTGKTPQAISRALGGNQNLGVHTMLQLAIPLGQTVRINVEPLEKLEEVQAPKELIQFSAVFHPAPPSQQFTRVTIGGMEITGDRHA